jgi:hypothetical protein
MNLYTPISAKITGIALFFFLLTAQYTNAQVCAAFGTNLQYNVNDVYNSAANFTYTFTAGTGSNRAMVLVITYESNNNNQNNDFNQITYGGQVLTVAANIQFAATASTPSNRTGIFYLNEAGIAAATNTTVDIDFSNANEIGGIGITTIMLRNVNQATPIGDTRTNTASANSITVTSFAADNGDFIITGVNSSSSGSDFTSSAGYIVVHEDQLNASHSRAGSYSQLTAASAAEQPSFTVLPATTPRLGIAVVEINPNSTGSSCGFALPVTITGFSANINNNTTLLNWQVADETAIRHYEIERRESNANTFNSIGVKTAANQPGSYSYSFVDPLPVNGTVFYRLKIINADGSHFYSSIIAVKSGTLSKSSVATVFQSSINVLIPSRSNQPVQISLSDAYGRIVHSQQGLLSNGSNSVQIVPRSHLAKGMYWLRIVREEGSEVISLMHE